MSPLITLCTGSVALLPESKRTRSDWAGAGRACHPSETCAEADTRVFRVTEVMDRHPGPDRLVCLLMTVLGQMAGIASRRRPALAPGAAAREVS